MSKTPQQLGQDRKRRAEGFLQELHALQARWQMEIVPRDDDLVVYDTKEPERTCVAEIDYNGGVSFDQEAVDPEGYAEEQDISRVPMPAEKPEEYRQWKERHAKQAEIFERAVVAGIYVTKPTEEFPWTLGGAAERWKVYKDFYSGGTRALCSEDFGYHHVSSFEWLARPGTAYSFHAGEVAGTATFGQQAAAETLRRQSFGGTSDPKEYRP